MSRDRWTLLAALISRLGLWLWCSKDAEREAACRLLLPLRPLLLLLLLPATLVALLPRGRP